MRPYSMDLRQRVAQAVEQGQGSLRQLAQRFLVSLSFIVRLLALRRQTGSLAPRPHSRGPTPLLDCEGLQRLLHLLREEIRRHPGRVGPEAELCPHDRLAGPARTQDYPQEEGVPGG